MAIKMLVTVITVASRGPEPTLGNHCKAAKLTKWDYSLRSRLVGEEPATVSREHRPMIRHAQNMAQGHGWNCQVCPALRPCSQAIAFIAPHVLQQKLFSAMLFGVPQNSIDRNISIQLPRLNSRFFYSSPALPPSRRACVPDIQSPIPGTSLY